MEMTSIPKVEMAEKWKKIQRYNFISAVLHGTTKTHSDYLKDQLVVVIKLMWRVTFWILL